MAIQSASLKVWLLTMSYIRLLTAAAVLLGFATCARTVGAARKSRFGALHVEWRAARDRVNAERHEVRRLQIRRQSPVRGMECPVGGKRITGMRRLPDATVRSPAASTQSSRPAMRPTNVANARSQTAGGAMRMPTAAGNTWDESRPRGAERGREFAAVGRLADLACTYPRL